MGISEEVRVAQGENMSQDRGLQEAVDIFRCHCAGALIFW